jgi:hypothetical protein
MTNQDDRPVPHDPVVARFLVARMAAREREARRSATLGHCLAWLFSIGPRTPRRPNTPGSTSGPVERRSSNAQPFRAVQSRTLSVADRIRLEPRIVPL